MDKVELRECAEYAQIRDKGIIAFTEFTHRDGFIDSETADLVALTARRLGLYGIQAPGTKPERITRLRKVAGPDMVIVSCGIGAQGPKAGSAIGAGADFEIVGRAISSAQNPALAAKTIRDLVAEKTLEA